MDGPFPACPRCRELEAQVAALERRVANLSEKIEAQAAQIEKLTAALEASQRAGKRQAAPFRKADRPKAEPQKPGRKSGDEHGPHAHRAAVSLEQIDERYDVPLPPCCPHCGGQHLGETHTAVQHQTEIVRRAVHREFTLHLGRCGDCRRPVQGRHPLQTSDALGAAASQLGGEAHAALAILNKDFGLSHGKSARLFQTLFGIEIARATSARSILRTARAARPAYRQLRADIRGSPWVVPDETGWRVAGKNAWLHVFVGERTTCYDIGDRSGTVAQRLLGANWSGTLIHDGWGPYDGFLRAFHQQCLGHLQRRCQELLETVGGAAARLPRQVLALIDEAFTLRRQWRGRRLNGDELAEAGLGLACRLQHLASGRFTYAPNRRLARHILSHAMHWFWFLIDPTIDATNWRAEQAIRPAVVNRKVWGGNRTWAGAAAQSVLASLLVTLRQRGHEALRWLSTARRNHTPLALPA